MCNNRAAMQEDLRDMNACVPGWNQIMLPFAIVASSQTLQWRITTPDFTAHAAHILCINVTASHIKRSPFWFLDGNGTNTLDSGEVNLDTKVKPTRQRRECMYFGIYCPPRFGFDYFFSLNKPRLIYLPPSLSKATSIPKKFVNRL